MDYLSNFSHRLKEYMTENAINAAGLAEKIHSNRTSVSEYLRGIHFPSTEIFFNMLRLFNCSADDLLGLTDFPTERNFVSMPPFGQRFRQVLKECGYSQYRLEKEMNLSASIVYQWLFDKSLPSVESLIALALHLGCSVDYLIGRID